MDINSRSQTFSNEVTVNKKDEIESQLDSNSVF